MNSLFVEMFTKNEIISLNLYENTLQKEILQTLKNDEYVMLRQATNSR
jgi:hypothetical protein